MLARVKQDYKAGSVFAFSGREYIRSEWREVPAGFEEEAKRHELLDTQPSLDEIRARSSAMAPGLPEPPAVTTVTETPPEVPEAETAPPETAVEPTEPPPTAEDPEPKTPRSRRKRAAED